MVCNYDYIILVETWLSSDIFDTEFGFNSYNVFIRLYVLCHLLLSMVLTKFLIQFIKNVFIHCLVLSIIYLIYHYHLVVFLLNGSLAICILFLNQVIAMLCSALPKLLEKMFVPKFSVMFNNLITDNQHGYSHRKSTMTNLLVFYTDLVSWISKGVQVNAVYTDLKKNI